MPWWIATIIILCSIILIMVILIVVVKFNKKIDAEANIGDKGVALKIENDAPAAKNEEDKLNVEMSKYGCSDKLYDFIKDYIVSVIESHMLITTVFYTVQYTNSINDKIFLKILKNEKYNELRNLNIEVSIIQKFFKEYVFKLQEYINKYILEIKEEIDDINKLRSNIDKLCKLFETDTFISSAIQDFKNKGFIATMIDGEVYTVTSDKLDDTLLLKFKDKIKKSSVELVSELKLSKARLLFTENKIVNILSVMNSINSIFDAIIKHIYTIYFECKPAVIGDSKGV